MHRRDLYNIYWSWSISLDIWRLYLLLVSYRWCAFWDAQNGSRSRSRSVFLLCVYLHFLSSWNTTSVQADISSLASVQLCWEIQQCCLAFRIYNVVSHRLMIGSARRGVMNWEFSCQWGFFNVRILFYPLTKWQWTVIGYNDGSRIQRWSSWGRRKHKIQWTWP